MVPPDELTSLGAHSASIQSRAAAGNGRGRHSADFSDPQEGRGSVPLLRPSLKILATSAASASAPTRGHAVEIGHIVRWLHASHLRVGLWAVACGPPSVESKFKGGIRK
jgi:hypothetical protein